jgi:hypothetical protein
MGKEASEPYVTIFSGCEKQFLLLLMSQLLKKKQGLILSANLMYWNNYFEGRTYRSSMVSSVHILGRKREVAFMTLRSLNQMEAIRDSIVDRTAEWIVGGIIGTVILLLGNFLVVIYNPR